MIDTHCHINFKAFKKDSGEVIKRFGLAGGKALVCVGAKINTSRVACELSKTHTICFAAVGIHPHHATSVVNLNTDMDEIVKLTDSKKVIAIGETGLDKYQYKNYPPITYEILLKQTELFKRHIDVAIKAKLPLIIHARKAHKDVTAILKKILITHPLEGVFHCFDGESSDLKDVLDLGFYVGFDGNITYPENENLRDLVKTAPLERILIETDSPYLTPQVFRGTRNEPSYITEVVKTISAVKKVSYEEVVSKTSSNAKSLFRI